MEAAAIPVIPGYELFRCIGRGAYGEVWLGRDAMGVWRAVKVVWRDRFHHARPFEREFEGLEKFMPVSRSHESQVDILHLGRENGWFYYVMELADDQKSGQEIEPDTYEPRTLASELETNGRLPAEDCLAVGAALATALEHLHAHGLVHRDIKPSNIVFVHGRPKLADIGLVSDAGAAMSFVGTEGFVPPEGPGTGQADLYSLGRVLYQLHTGNPQAKFPDLPLELASSENPALSRELNLIILKACAPGCDLRHESAAALREELLLLQSGHSIHRLRQREKRARLLARVGLATGIAALLALAGGAIAWRGERKAAEALIAEERREKAVINERARTRELIQSATATGLMRVNASDSFASLLPLVEALELETDSQRIESDRTRLACILAYSPHIQQAFFHEGIVNRIVLSPDGSRLLTASGDGTARVWPLDRPEEPALILTHPGGVNWASWGANGTRIVTACADGVVRLWNAADGAKQTPEFRHDGAVLRAELSADATTVASGGADKTFRIWDAATGDTRGQETLDWDVRSVAISPNGRLIAAAAAGNGASLGIWDAATGKKLQGPLENMRWCQEASFSPDGSRLGAAGWTLAGSYDAETGGLTAHLSYGEMMNFFTWNRDGSRYLTGSFDAQAFVVSADTGSALARIRHAQPPTGGCFSPGGSRVATLCEDGTARVWASDGGRPLSPPLHHSGMVTSATFTHDGGRLITAGIDGMVRMWELNPASSEPVHLEHSGMIRSGRFSKDGALFLTASDDSKVRLWKTPSGTLAYEPLDPGGPATDAVFDPAERRIAAITAWSERDIARISVWDAATGRTTAPSASITGHGLRIAFSGDGREMVTLTCGSIISDFVNQRVHVGKGSVAIRRWDAVTVIPLTEAVDTGGGAWFATLSNDGRHAAVAYKSSTPSFQTWDTATGRPLSPRVTLPASAWHLEFSPDGNRLAVTTEPAVGAGACVYDARTGQPVSVPLPHSHAVYFAGFSADGHRLVTTSADGAARVWDSETGAPLTAPLRHEWKTVHAGFSGDGKRLITASGDRTARLWDVDTGELLAPPLPYSKRLFWSWLHPGGHTVITTGNDGVCMLWKFPFSNAPIDELRTTAELLAGERRDARFGIVPLTRAELRQRWEVMQGK